MVEERSHDGDRGLAGREGEDPPLSLATLHTPTALPFGQTHLEVREQRSLGDAARRCQPLRQGTGRQVWPGVGVEG